MLIDDFDNFASQACSVWFCLFLIQHGHEICTGKIQWNAGPSSTALSMQFCCSICFADNVPPLIVLSGVARSLQGKGAMQVDKKAFEADAKARATANSSSRYGQQEVCQISGLIINSEETRVRDHKMGRNYRCAQLYILAHSAAYAYYLCAFPPKQC